MLETPRLEGVSAALSAAVSECGGQGQIALGPVWNQSKALEITRSHGFKGSERAASGSPTDVATHCDPLAARCPLLAWVTVTKGPKVTLLLSRTPLLCP